MKNIKLPDHYVYTAIFTYGHGQEIAVTFPDLDVATSGIDDADALLSARELLGCVLFGLEEDGKFIPSPSPLSQIKLDKNERAALIDVYRSDGAASFGRHRSDSFSDGKSD